MAWALLFGGITVIDILEESPQIKPTLQFVKPESARLYLHHDQAFIATSIEGYSLKELYLFAGGTQAPGWQKVEEAVLDPYTEEILIPQNDTVILSDVHQGSWALFEVPPGWAGVVEDLHDMQAQFIGQGLVVRLMMTLALAFVMYSIWTLVRLTRWPLLNALLAFATVRGLLMLAVLSADSAVIELFLVVFNRSEPWFGMLIGYFILGLIFFLWGIILQPFGRWSKEVHV